MLQIGPALSEISALRRIRDVLTKDVTALRQQVCKLEAARQATTDVAAKERADAGRTLAAAQQRLAGAVQRLCYMKDQLENKDSCLQEVSEWSCPPPISQCCQQTAR